MDAWVDRELGGGEFPDRRLKARLGKILGDLGRRIGGTLPAACQDWAATKAAYRFFSNPRVDEGVILAGHFAATTARFAATAGPILVLHDTTEFSFTRDNPDGDRPALAPQGPARHRHPLRAADALQPRPDPRGRPAGPGGRQVLDPQEVQGDQRPEAEGQPHPHPDRAEGERPLAGEPEAVHASCWATRPGASTSATARATSSSCSAPPRRRGPTSWSAPAWTGWPAAAARRSPR